MNSTPLVSVIVAIYNAEKYLRRCVNSLVNQTLHDIQILLIDDGSTDNSGAICDEYAAKDSRVKVFHRSNHGVAATRQFGLEQATGIYVIHADSDDWVDLDMYEKMYQVAENEQADMVISDYVEEHKGKSIHRAQKPSSSDSNAVLADIFTFLYGACWNKLIRLEAIRKYNIDFVENVNFGEDKIFNVRLLQHPIKVAYCPNVLYHYDQIINPRSAVHENSAQMVYHRVNYSKILRKYQQSPIMEHGITKNDIYIAFMAIRTNAYSPEEFYKTFPELKSASIWPEKEFPFHMRFIVWCAFHINYRTAKCLMAFKLWFRKNIKRVEYV